MVFPEFPILLNNPFLLFPSYKHHSYSDMHGLLLQSSPSLNNFELEHPPTTPTIPKLFLTFTLQDGPDQPSLHLPTHSQCPVISLFLCVLFSGTVIITSRSSNIFDSVPPLKSSSVTSHKSVTSSPAGEER